MKELVDILVQGNHSLVVQNDQGTTTYDGRGVSDLYHLLAEQPEVLHNATITDKIVGKGAAALMILGGIRTLHALTISSAAIELLQSTDIQTTWDKEVPYIINRAGTAVAQSRPVVPY